jgi:hypothetical protein
MHVVGGLKARDSVGEGGGQIRASGVDRRTRQ